MKRIAALLLLLLGTAAGFAQAPSAPAETRLSPAERSMDQARKLIEKNPKDFEAYNALALALSRRARETSDVKFYAQAEETLQKSFDIAPDNFDGERIHVWLLLGKHEFAAARDAAMKLNQKMPDDVMLYGFLTDANVELGNYKDAETAAQWMLDLKPGNTPGLTRAAYLRELFGDIEGSLELMNMAYQSTPPGEVEDGAWIVTQMAHLKLAIGKIDEAEKLSQQALIMFPGYHYALGNLAKVRIQQKRYDEAVVLLKAALRRSAARGESVRSCASPAVGREDRRCEQGLCRVRTEISARNQSRRQFQSRVDLLLRGLCRAAGRSARSSATGNRPPARCVHVGLLRLGAISERSIRGRKKTNRNRSGGWCPRREDVPSRW